MNVCCSAQLTRMPVQILKSTNMDGWSAVSDEEVEAILPTAEYALAKIHMHLVHSGFCYTARGGFCYSEDDIFDFRTGIFPLDELKKSPYAYFVAVRRAKNDGQDIDGLPTEGIEITCFHLDGAHYMIYTPSDPLLFVAVKDQNGLLQIADDVNFQSNVFMFRYQQYRFAMLGLGVHLHVKEHFAWKESSKGDLLEDPAIMSAIDEETEFNALVEEEAALLESLLGER
ncbi:Detected protein of confused Function [Hibiscus syriacus]|uniref:Detected protein of confused Function n=1 Tax=Hibiscus syriacus TaxID=106335 RepID=A0A6A3AWM4_HIBSY|nr:Detected protein of confused Function [Hibiscus syriacus]